MLELLSKTLGRERATDSGSERQEEARDAPRGTATVESSPVTDTAAEADTDGQPVPLDQIFGILSNQRRRRVLRNLMETKQFELGDLAERLAGQENDKSREQLSSKERKRVYVSLYQVHLPKLADVDAITYNKSRGIIEPGPTFDSFTYYLPDDRETAAAETQNRGWRAFIANIFK